MTKQTEAAIMAICAADGTIPPDRTAAAIAALLGETPKPATRPPCGREEAAAIVGCCTSTITNYANAGLIRRVFGPGSRRGAHGRSVRYSREDCERIARGEVGAAFAAAV